ncbi:isoprenylcysteine carboxyl methyltransferase [Dysgonomonas sp. HDW5B]|uniref:isoprenylcysteine carboxyl methyltransferase family protein n=1 Tax=Dysgonomonas sp. HDW5B TaxID=2714927 RepID=UPI001409D777|nr:isoprenylcysteine carboxylmethyltransferase family protein [Dysgonomonas sp. HDW5B]QIK54893.1 isoprenylcysteine carboxyl methyltransferase [Dysgonomonas sp. HDW5B]
MAFILFISFVILLRIGELVLARSNERWLLQQGAVEYGKEHYPFMVALHASFFVSLIIEYTLTQTVYFNVYLFILFLILIAFKAWIISSLGKFWNTKIYRVSNFPLINKGPYRYLKHPNYIVVIAEIAIIPLVFQLYYTAIIFTLLNAVMLAFRIKEENKALRL